MVDILPIRKAMIVIAVSKYNGLPDLPGTLTSANRMVEWAEGNSPARNYTVLKITDEDWVDSSGKTHPGKPVTRNRLEDEIRPFIENQIWDRVVVYFAGHGMVGTSLTDYWLLHNAMGDPADGVNFLQFKAAMERQGIGSLAAVFGLNAGQVSYIVDACRAVEAELLGFSGSPILKWPNDTKPLETDLFLSTIQGSYAFQPNAVEGRAAYCLFSDALSDALEGRIPEVIEHQHHKHAPVITSSTLANWIRTELPKRAQKFKEKLEADPKPGFVTANDYYEVFQPFTEVESDTGPKELDENSVEAPNDESAVKTDGDDEGLFPLSTSHWSQVRVPGLHTGDKLNRSVDGGRVVRKNFPPKTQGYAGAVENPMRRAEKIAGAPISIEGRTSVAVPMGMCERLEVESDHINYWPTFGLDGVSPIFVKSQLHKEWLLVPAFSSTTSSVVLSAYPDDVFIVDLHGMLAELDLSLTRFAGLQPSRMSDAIQIADSIRAGKSLYPNKANRAGYLYYIASDRDNALRTAHFMAQEDLLSFDLAQIAAQSITYSQHLDQWIAFADLKAIDRDPEDSGDRPAYTKLSFDARKGVPLTSPFPIYRQGWDLLQIAGFDNIPKVLHEVAARVRGHSATVFHDEEMRMLVRHFNYEVIEFGG